MKARGETREARRRAQEEITHSQRLLLALSQAAQAVQRARTPEEVYETIGREVAGLGYNSSVFMLTENRAHLAIAHLTLPGRLQRAAEKLTGLSARDFRFPLTPGGVYQRIIAEGRTAFYEPFVAPIAEALPEPLRPLAARVAATLKLEQAIVAPLAAGGEVVGLLTVSGSGLTEADVPAVTVFANQAAIALENVRLYAELEQRVEERTVALEQSEEKLKEAQALGRIGNWEFDVDNQTINWSDEVYRLYERDPGLGPPTVEEEAAYYAPEQARILREYARRAAEEGREFAYDLQAKLPGGTLAHFSATMRPVKDESGRVIRLFGTVQDITERRRAEEALEKRTRALALLNQASQSFSATLNPEQVLAAVLEEVRNLLDITASSIWIVDPETQELVCRQATGPGRDVVSGWRLAPRTGIAGWVAHHGESLIVADALADERHFKGIDEQTGVLLRSILSVPLRAKQTVIGVLQASDTRVGHFDAADLALLESLAASAAIAIENARLYQQAQQEIGERKQVEEALAAERTLLRAIIDILPTLVYAKDTACRKFLSNRVDLEYTGASAEAEVLGKTDFDFYPEDMAAQFYARDRAIIETGQPVIDYEHSIVTADGRWRWLLTSKVPLRDSAGQVIGLVGVGRDITERKQAEEALKRRATQMELINDIGSEIAAVAELDSVLERAAHLVQENFGYHHVALFTLDHERGELVMRARSGGFAHLFPPQHRIRLGEGMVGWVAAHGETLLANDVDAEPRYTNFYPGVLPTRAELSVPIRVGTEIVGAIDVQSEQPGAFDENDLLVIETLADEIAVAIENARLYQELRQHAEELERRVQERTTQLRTQYARLETVLSSTSDGIIVTDSQGQILLANPVAQAWLGMAVSEGDGKSVQANAPEAPTALPAEEAKRLQEAVRGLTLRAAERPEMVLELVGLDLQLNVAPISETGDDSATAVVVVHDVSQLKALDRLKSQFVSNVSHELRTPATTVKLYAALLRRSDPEKWPEYLDALTQEADRQARLVESVLQVSRIDAGRLELKPQPASLNELVEAAVASHRALAQERGLALERRLMEEGPAVLVDRERMMQVLNNLVENAIRYAPQGKVEVVAGQAEMEGRTWATINVSDTGIGIPEDELAHVFERFFRGDQPRQMQMPGSGLGLAIAKEIVELHGGRITVESQVGVGSIFIVWLPLTEG
jgi:PAS domain S-box-containing protein